MLEPKDTGESNWMIIPLTLIGAGTIVTAWHIKRIADTLLNIYLQINP